MKTKYGGKMKQKKVLVDLNNPMHQLIMVKLTLMYYSSGDVKDVYWDEELYNQICDQFPEVSRPPEPFGDIEENWLGFEEMAGFLNKPEVRNIYCNWERLKVMPNMNHMG